MKVTVWMAITLVAGTGLPACAQAPTLPLPAPPPVLDLTMRDYDFRLRQPVVRAGRVVFVARNTGRVDHEVVVLPLPQDVVGRLDDEVRSPTEKAVSTLTQLPAQQAGAVATFALDLPAGNYGLVCLLKDAAGLSHAARGMNAELRVTARP